MILRFLADIWWWANHWKFHVSVTCDTPGTIWRMTKLRRWIVERKKGGR